MTDFQTFTSSFSNWGTRPVWPAVWLQARTAQAVPAKKTNPRRKRPRGNRFNFLSFHAPCVRQLQ